MPSATKNVRKRDVRYSIRNGAPPFQFCAIKVDGIFGGPTTSRTLIRVPESERFSSNFPSGLRIVCWRYLFIYLFLARLIDAEERGTK